MRVRVVREFNDLEANKVRNLGEVFDVTPERFVKLENSVFAPLVVKLAEEPHVKRKQK